MARIPEIVARLTRWQEWYFSSQAAGVKSPQLRIKVDRERRIDGLIDYREEEALETDQAAAHLPEDLREIVKVVYLDPEGRTMDSNAAILKMSRVSLYRKLELVDQLLLGILNKEL